MNIKSKKVLPYVAAAVAASCGVASAATLTVTPTYASTERLTAEVTAVPSYTVGLPKLEIKVGSDAYRTGDTIAVTVAGGTVSSASAGGWDCGDAAGGNGVSGVMTFSLSSVSGNVLTYAVARTTNDSPVYLSAATARTCSLAAGAILLVGNSISSGVTTSVNFEPRGSGIAYDALTGSSATGGVGAVNVFYAATQYILPTSSTRNFLGQGAAGTNAATTATISTAGTSFGTGTAGNSLSISWSTRDEGATSGLMNASTLVNAVTGYITTTLTGDFSFLDDDSNGCTAADLTAGAGRAAVTAGAVYLGINSACTVLTVAASSTAGTQAADRTTPHTLKFFLNGMDDSGTASSSGSLSGKTINPQTIAGSVTWRNTATSASATLSTTKTFTAATLSATTSTQSGINVPYLPYGTGISRIVYLTNKGSASAVVTISGKSETGTVCSSTNFATVTVPAGGVGLLTSAIDAGISACLGASYVGKVNIDLSVSGSSSNVVTSAYNVSGNRVNVLNSTN